MRTSFLCFAVLLLGCGARGIDPGSGGGSGSSTTTSATGGEGCPVLEPNDGDLCTTPGQVCVLSATCCSPTATCTGGIWSVPAPTCAQPCVPCGDASCGGSGVCVTVEGALSSPLQHHCAVDPCGGQPLTCACAAFLCPNGCDGAGSGMISCY